MKFRRSESVNAAGLKMCDIVDDKDKRQVSQCGKKYI
jgi:hypothetical protein